MISEGTSGKWSLWATHPNRLGGIAEMFTTEVAADARANDLKRVGYKVEVFASGPGSRLMSGSSAVARLALLRHQ